MIWIWERFELRTSALIKVLTLCGGVLVNVDFTCPISVRLIMSSLAGHLKQIIEQKYN